MYRVLDLFSGIGGFSLGLERTGGFETVAFCEIEKFPQQVLRKHWPDVPIYEDVRQITAGRLRADGIKPNAVTAGFPCQDISFAGKGAGIEGERSGLWKEVARIAGEVRPEIIILENVAALLSRGLDVVLGDLAEIGYDAEWHCIPASALGAPHRRDRWWCICYPHDNGQFTAEVTRSIGARGNGGAPWQEQASEFTRSGEQSAFVAYATSQRQQRQGQPVEPVFAAQIIERETVDAFASGVAGIWSTEPNVGRVANGIPRRVDRLKGLGNAVVPQIPELIGRAILDDKANHQ